MCLQYSQRLFSSRANVGEDAESSINSELGFACKKCLVNDWDIIIIF
jgi:hypothetical protein